MIIAGAQHPKLDPTDYGAMIRDLGLEDTVDLLKKHIPDEELDALYRQADICLFPYRDIYGKRRPFNGLQLWETGDYQ